MAGAAKLTRIYIDTSVIGGCLDGEFQAPSTRLFDRSRGGGVLLVVSDITLAEFALREGYPLLESCGHMTTKPFDAVKLMRELRDQLSREMEHMTAEERLRHIRAKARSTRLGHEVAEGERNAAQQGAP